MGTVMKQKNSRGSRRLKPEDYIKAAEMLANWPTEKVHLTALRERKGPIKGKSFVKTDIKGMASWMAERQSSPDRLNVYFHVNDLREDLGPGKPKASKKTDALFLAPDNVAMLAHLSGQNVQRDLVGNANRDRNLESSSDRGPVANRAIDTGAVELNRSGFEYSLSWFCTSLMHCAALS